MKRILVRLAGCATLALAILLFGPSLAPAGAQEVDLCELLGDPYCPPDVLGDVVPVGRPTVAPSGQRGQAGTSGATGTALARTGSDTGSLVGIGAALIGLGAVAAIGARRRAAQVRD